MTDLHLIIARAREDYDPRTDLGEALYLQHLAENPLDEVGAILAKLECEFFQYAENLLRAAQEMNFEGPASDLHRHLQRELERLLAINADQYQNRWPFMREWIQRQPDWRIIVNRLGRFEEIKAQYQAKKLEAAALKRPTKRSKRSSKHGWVEKLQQLLFQQGAGGDTSQLQTHQSRIIEDRFATRQLRESAIEGYKNIEKCTIKHVASRASVHVADLNKWKLHRHGSLAKGRSDKADRIERELTRVLKPVYNRET